MCVCVCVCVCAFNYDLNGLGVGTFFAVYSPLEIPADAFCLKLYVTGFQQFIALSCRLADMLTMPHFPLRALICLFAPEMKEVTED